MSFILTEQNYRDLFENANDAMWVQDLDGNFIATNRACEKLTGFSREELLTRNVKDFLLGDSLSFARSVAHRLLRGEEFIQPYEQRVFRKDGSTRTVKMSTSLVAVAGRPAGFEHVARDVTEEHRMSEMLAEITNGSPIPTFVIDKDHLVTHWNTALQSLTAIRAQEMLGSDNQWRAFYARRRPTLADMIVDRASPEQIEVYYKGKFKKSNLIDGAYEAEDFIPLVNRGRWLRFTASPLKNSFGEIIAALEALQDVTEEKAMQESMRYYVQMITRAQEEERKRLARDLHDDVSSALLLLIRSLDAAIPEGKSRQNAKYKATIEGLHDQAVTALQHVRSYVQDLRPRILDDLGLKASLEWMADNMQKNDRIQASVSVTGEHSSIPSEVQLLLFRIAQEALFNIRRHAKAKSAEIRLDVLNTEDRLDCQR